MSIDIYSGLPSMEYLFSIDVTGETTNVKYSGDFLYRRPTIQIRSNIARTIAKLNGNIVEGLDDDIKSLHQLIAWLEHCIVEAPKWWTDSKCGRELYDNNVISELSTKVMEFEDQWRSKINPQTASTPPKA